MFFVKNLEQITRKYEQFCSIRKYEQNNFTKDFEFKQNRKERICYVTKMKILLISKIEFLW